MITYSNLQSTTIVVALIGQKYSGKDTVADYLVDKYQFSKFALATPIKDIAMILFRFAENQDKDLVDARWGITPRQAFQFIGTDLFRNQFDRLVPEVGAQVWINNLIARIEESCADLVVISDVRFINELDMLKTRFSRVIAVKIIRPDTNLDSHIQKIRQSDQHISEVGIKEITPDYTLINDRDFDCLFKQTDALIDAIRTHELAGGKLQTPRSE